MTVALPRTMAEECARRDVAMLCIASSSKRARTRWLGASRSVDSIRATLMTESTDCTTLPCVSLKYVSRDADMRSNMVQPVTYLKQNRQPVIKQRVQRLTRSGQT